MPFQHPEDTIILESLFINPTPEGANELGNQDMYRFQIPPEAQEVLLSNLGISNVVKKVSSTVLQLTKKLYLLQKISLL
jgi:hypothetical protein